MRTIAAVLICLTGIAFGQNTAAQSAFDAASVKVSQGYVRGGLQMKGGPGTSDPGRVTWGMASLQMLMERAWDVDSPQIVGPSWLDGIGDMYTITATMPPETTRQQFQLMLQSLLIERFQIKLHHETRTFPGYELVVAPGGSKLKLSADTDTPEPSTGASGELDANGFLVLPPGHGSAIASIKGMHVKFQNFTMAELTTHSYLQGFVSQANGSSSMIHLVDKTGLTGKYDFTLKFDQRQNNAPLVSAQIRASLPPPESSANDPGSGLPDLFKAIEQQWGLRLVKVKGFELDTIVIDHAEKIPIDQ